MTYTLHDIQSIAHQAIDHIRSRHDIRLETHIRDTLSENTSIESALADFLHSYSTDIQNRLRDEFLGFGPLTRLSQDPYINEIIMNQFDEIWVEKDGQFHVHPDKFLSALTFENFVHRLCMEMGGTVDLNQPVCDGKWRQFRVHVIRTPLCAGPFQLTLRRHREDPWTLNMLEKEKWCPPDLVSMLQTLMHQRTNILVIGPTGSGKTSVLGALLNVVPQNERVVLVEDTPELHLPNSLSTKLLTRHDRSGHLKNFSLSDLIKESLRMRPDRLVIGEVRGQESKDLLLALATGHSGSLATLHADHPHQALYRLEMLIQMGAPQWSLDSIRKLIHLSLQVILWTGYHHNKRCLKGLDRIAGLESTGFLLDPLYRS